MDSKIDMMNEIHGNESQTILDFLTKLSLEMKEMKASVNEMPKQNELVQKKSFDDERRKEPIKMEEFFKQKFSRRGPTVKQEVHVDEIEESPRERLWKKYGDYRGEFELHCIDVHREVQGSSRTVRLK